MINEPKIVEITEIVTETPTIKTFKFDWDYETLGNVIDYTNAFIKDDENRLQASYTYLFVYD